MKICRLIVPLIYLLLTSCEDRHYCSEYYLEISAPNLQQSNGFYNMEYLPNYVQTFTTLEAQTCPRAQYQKLAWMSNREILIYDSWTDLVNEVSYTDENGKAYTVFAAWEQFIGDTVTVYCGFEDECGIQYSDSLKMIIN